MQPKALMSRWQYVLEESEIPGDDVSMDPIKRKDRNILYRRPQNRDKRASADFRFWAEEQELEGDPPDLAGVITQYPTPPSTP
jgi:hypothetical protein